jgi:hypothetical protein
MKCASKKCVLNWRVRAGQRAGNLELGVAKRRSLGIGEGSDVTARGGSPANAAALQGKSSGDLVALPDHARTLQEAMVAG